MPPRFFHALSMLSLVGLIVGIVGAITAVDDSDLVSYSINGEIEAALVLFIAVYAMTLYCFGMLTLNAIRSSAKRIALGREVYILSAVGLSMPFLLVRLIYACIADYGNDSRFSFFGGNNTIKLCMSVLVELIVTTICLTAGFFVPPPTEQVKNAQSQETQSEGNQYMGLD